MNGAQVHLALIWRWNPAVAYGSRIGLVQYGLA